MFYVVFITKIALTSLIVLMGYSIIFLVGIFVTDKLQLYYRNWQVKKRDKRWQKEYQELMQQQRRWELEWILRKEKIEKQRKEEERYPLFNWLEMCDRKQKGLKNGDS